MALCYIIVNEIIEQIFYTFKYSSYCDNMLKKKKKRSDYHKCRDIISITAPTLWKETTHQILKHSKLGGIESRGITIKLYKDHVQL